MDDTQEEASSGHSSMAPSFGHFDFDLTGTDNQPLLSDGNLDFASFSGYFEGTSAYLTNHRHKPFMDVDNYILAGGHSAHSLTPSSLSAPSSRFQTLGGTRRLAASHNVDLAGDGDDDEQRSVAGQSDGSYSSGCCEKCVDCESQCGESVQGDICRDSACTVAASPCTDADCMQRDEDAAKLLTSLQVNPESPLSGQLANSQLTNFGLSDDDHHHTSSNNAFLASWLRESGDLPPNFGFSMGYSADDMILDTDDGLLGDLAQHVLSQHNPAAHHAESQCIRPCMVDNLNLNWNFQTCNLPRPGFPDAIHQEPECHHNIDTRFFDHPCGATISNPDAFIEHVNLQHRQTNALLGQRQVPSSSSLALHMPYSLPLEYEELYSRQNNSINVASGHSVSQKASPLASSTTQSSALEARAVPETPGTSLSSGQQSVAIDVPFVCRWGGCNHTFSDDDDLQAHVKDVHLKDLGRSLGKGFMCLWTGCSRKDAFTQKSKLERHLQTHTGFKPVSCDICGLTLSAKQSLEQHKRIHSGEKPWVCTYEGCNKAFKQQSALTMHIRTHTGEKPLECPICFKRFGESSNLSKHIKTHNGKGEHVCSECGKDFCRLDQLRRHRKTHEGSKFLAKSDEAAEEWDTAMRPIKRVKGRVNRK